MISKEEFTLSGKDGKPVGMDLTYSQSSNNGELIVFVHGFKGFKDWGTFNHLAASFAKEGYPFLKVNFSHNGVTPENLVDFVDLEAFGNNTITKELNDLELVLDWIESNLSQRIPVKLDKLTLIGFSRGGGTALIKAGEDHRVKRIVTWASIADFKTRFTSDEIEYWRANKVVYIPNARTGQKMPLYVSLLEDFEKNETRLTIEEKVKNLQIPMLIVQGEEDETVLPEEAFKLQGWYPKAKLITIPNAGHTFNGRHPFDEEKLPDETKQLIVSTIDFLEAN